jgi:molybdenum cofactor cytidylyltransferase
MDLAEALECGRREVVAFVGAGGKTTAVFRLVREAAGLGRRAVASGTARFSEARGGSGLPQVVEEDEDRLLDGVRAALERSNAVIAAAGRFGDGRFTPISYQAVAAMAVEPGIGLVALEADGARMRPFKAPAEHEPALPPAATLVVAVAGADAFGRPLDEASAHRLDRVLALSGADRGDPITPGIVARVLAHPEGGGKSRPTSARFAVLINKVDAVTLPSARETAALLHAAGVETVVLARLQDEDPVLEVSRAPR